MLSKYGETSLAEFVYNQVLELTPAQLRVFRAELVERLPVVVSEAASKARELAVEPGRQNLTQGDT